MMGMTMGKATGEGKDARRQVVWKITPLRFQLQCLERGGLEANYCFKVQCMQPRLPPLTTHDNCATRSR
jgi:hypothetical protein